MKITLWFACAAVLGHGVDAKLRSSAASTTSFEIGPDGSMIEVAAPITMPDLLSSNLRAAGAQRRLVHATKHLGSDPEFQLGRCEGDCDDDDDCRDEYVCWQREPNDPVPGCLGGEDDNSAADYCVPQSAIDEYLEAQEEAQAAKTITSYDPQAIIHDFMQHQVARTNFLGGHSSANGPLAECQGHCANDHDCAAGLECFYRDGGESVPGCNRDNDMSGSDYCVAVNQTYLEYPVYGVSDEPFRMKLYWQHGYYWQEETFERKWCMLCKKPGHRERGPCLKNHEMFIDVCNPTNNEYFVFIHTRRNQALLMILDTHLCLERDLNSVFMNDCDIFNHNQLWFPLDFLREELPQAERDALPPVSFFNEKFEMSQRVYSGRCLTQRHHPKPWEWMEIEPCADSRRLSNTTYWEPIYDYSD